VLLAVVGGAVGTMVLLMSRVVQVQQIDAVTAEEEAIYRGIVGDQKDTFGFLGDVGDYPNSLADLVVDPGLAGWNGPYVLDPRFANGTLLDPWNQPYEEYLADNGAGSDQLAIISRGPDGQSTNTSTTPNVASTFAGGLPPTDPAYFSHPKNADNRVFPTPNAGHADALNVNTTSTLALNIQNFDQNPAANAFVPACPNLYNVTVTSISRGTDDVPASGYAPGFQVLLPQGTYRVSVYSVLQPNTVLVNDRFPIYAAVPITRAYNLTGLDSSGTDLFVLTVTDNSPSQDIDVFSFTTKLGTVNHLTTKTFTPHGCAAIKVYKAGQTTNPINSYTMPLGNFTDNEYTSASTLTVTNHQAVPVNVYDNGVLIGSVGNGKTVTFNKNLFAGDVITIKNQKTGALLQTLTLSAGANSTTV
jgi:hypothetical protein